MWVYSKEVLIKSSMQIAQAGFSFDCMKTTQEYLMYFKQSGGKMQARCVPRFIQRFPNYISRIYPRKQTNSRKCPKKVHLWGFDYE